LNFQRETFKSTYTYIFDPPYGGEKVYIIIFILFYTLENLKWKPEGVPLDVSRATLPINQLKSTVIQRITVPIQMFISVKNKSKK